MKENIEDNFISKLKESFKKINIKDWIAIFFAIISFMIVVIYYFFTRFSIGILIFAIVGTILFISILFYLMMNEHFNDKIRENDFYISEDSKIVTEEILNDVNITSDQWVEQYKLCVESEHYYESIMWDVGKILLTGSAAAIPLAISVLNNSNYDKSLGVAIIIFSFVLYTVFLMVSKRYRASIRNFRNVARIIEDKLNFLPLKYVYDFEKKGFGNPMRMWTIFVTLYGFLITGCMYVVLSLYFA